MAVSLLVLSKGNKLLFENPRSFICTYHKEFLNVSLFLENLMSWKKNEVMH